MQLESAVPPDQRNYCPYPECGFMLERPSDPGEYADKPLDCPHCEKPFCISCGMTGGHKVREATAPVSLTVMPNLGQT
jgi:hypothetical protein